MLLLPPQALDARQDKIALNCAGDRIVIGSPYDSKYGENSGAAYLFDDSGNLLRIFHPPDPQPNNYFGSSVDINCDGSRIVVGAYNLQTDESNLPGAVFLFDDSGCIMQTFANPGLDKLAAEKNITNVEIDKIAFTGEPPQEEGFGKSVAINQNGDKIVIGSPAKSALRGISGLRKNAGIVFVYSDTGRLLKSLYAPTPNYENEFFGRDIAINADASKIVVGSPIRRVAYLYNDQGDLLAQMYNPNATDIGVSFGFSVSVDGQANVIVIGAPGGAESADPHGYAYIYNNQGKLMQAIASPQPQNGDAFGTSVSISDSATTIIVGAPYQNNYGVAYRYDRKGNEDTFVYTDNNGKPDRNNSLGFGWTAAQNSAGSRAAIGNWWAPGVTLLCFHDDGVSLCPRNEPPNDIAPLDYVCHNKSRKSFKAPTKEDVGFVIGMLILLSLFALFGYIYYRKFYKFPSHHKNVKPDILEMTGLTLGVQPYKDS